MITNCPHCRKTMRFSESQRARLEQALIELKPGKLLTIKCPHCTKAIQLDNTGSEGGSAATEVQPPAPPDLDWLTTGRFEGEEKVEDVPMALVLFNDAQQQEVVKNAMESVGYQVMTVYSVHEAIARMRFVDFSCVVFQSEFEGSLEQSTFHDYMQRMPMERRRYMFYVLIGSRFHTLYNLEALSHSANLVVNDSDLKYFDVVLRKAIPEYEELFGSMLEELGAYGKR
ncbi:MAG: hypothetical protein GQ559_00220 [Desulfobulbaceae bacterium]|nr:hypothetical protein [Desulfobulbaceae bacterium]